MKSLSEKETKKLVWLTWFEFLLVGVIVYLFSNPMTEAILLFGPIAVHAIINFCVKSKEIPVDKENIPSVFGPTACLTGFGAIAIAYVDGFNSLVIALASVCVLCLMVICPEHRYVYN